MQGLTLGHCQSIYADLGHAVEVDGDLKRVVIRKGADEVKIGYDGHWASRSANPLICALTHQLLQRVRPDLI